jgi:Predicted metal-sulfur cluster biosynthetic enzyme
MAIKKIPVKKEEAKQNTESGVSFTKFEHSQERAESVELTEEKVMEALKSVHDPEIPVDIVNLGLIYNVEISGNKVHLTMTLTTPGCGMGGFIAKQAENAVKEIGARDVWVDIVWDPPWNPDMISDEAKERLGISS